MIPHSVHCLIKCECVVLCYGAPPPDTKPSCPLRNEFTQRLCLPNPQSTWGIHADIIPKLLCVAPECDVSVVSGKHRKQFLQELHGNIIQPRPRPSKDAAALSAETCRMAPPQYLTTLSSKHGWHT